jgi:fucose permease
MSSTSSNAMQQKTSVQEGLQMGGLLTLATVLILMTIATASIYWQVSTGKNYYFDIGLWKWAAISKTNDNSTICGDLDQKEIYSDEKTQNAVVQVRYLTCFATGFVALSLLFMLGNKKKFIYMSAVSALIGFVLAISAVSIYSRNVWDKAELVNNMENINPTPPDWGYGLGFWFFVSSIALLAIAFVILLMYAKVMVQGSNVEPEPVEATPVATSQQQPIQFVVPPAGNETTPDAQV